MFPMDKSIRLKDPPPKLNTPFDPHFKVLSSNDYASSFKGNKESSPKFEDTVFQTLQWYEKCVGLLRGQLKLLQCQQTKELKARVFEKIGIYSRYQPVPSEPLTEEEAVHFETVTANPVYTRELAELIDSKVESERQEQEQFLESVRVQVYEDQIAEIEGTTEIARILQRKVVGKYIPGFNAIVNLSKARFSPPLFKTLFLGLSILVSTKIRERKQSAFRALMMNFTCSRPVANAIPLDLKSKGRKLMGLKEYPSMNLKRAFWRWYLVSTRSGGDLFQRAADNLVLYTNINKTTSFYRLMSKIKAGRREVDPKTKRMALMLGLYSRIHVERIMRDSFEKIRLKAYTMKTKATQRLIECAQARRNEAFSLWLRKAKEFRENQRNNKINKKLRDVLLRKIIYNRRDQVLNGWLKWKRIPQRGGYCGICAFRIASRFEKGLSNFIDRTLKRSFVAFKKELQRARLFKQRTVHQLVDNTIGPQRNFYRRWLSITEQTKLLNKCKFASSVFAQINFTIKCVADFAFSDKKEIAVKETGLIQIFKNIKTKVGDCFKRWREVNNIDKLREKLNNQQRKDALNVLNNLLSNRKNTRVRETIQKFKFNRRVTKIQRDFLKRLLITKAGLVVLAFKKLQSLPERKCACGCGYSKTGKFQRGLSAFIDRTLMRAFKAFKNQIENGRKVRNFAIIKLVNASMVGTKSIFNRWLSITESIKLFDKCKLASSVFASIRFSIKSVSDYAFANTGDIAIKKKGLAQMLENITMKVGDCLKRWRHDNNIEKLRERLCNQKQVFVSRVLFYLLKNRRNTQIREAIYKFRINSKITYIKRDFLRRLLMPKVVPATIAFTKWQKLPERRDCACHFCLRVERRLSNLLVRTLGRAFGAFKNELEEGQAFKKKVALQLVNAGMVGTKSIFNRWLSITESTKLFAKCKLVLSVFASLNFAIKSVVDFAFAGNKDASIKEQALTRIFDNLKIKTSHFFKAWRNIHHQRKRQAKASKKTLALDRFQNILKQHRKERILQAISQFKLNRTIVEIQRSFLKRLLLSKAHLIAQAFNKIRSLPSCACGYRHPARMHAKIDNIIKFPRKLQAFIDRTLKRAFDAFKSQIQNAKIIKECMTLRLVNVAVAKQRRLYNKWVQSVKMERIRAIGILFKNCQVSMGKIYSPLLVRRKYSLKQIELCQCYFSKLIDSQTDNMRSVLKALQSTIQQKETNRWFKKAAAILAANSKISVEKSFWRLRLNTDAAHSNYSKTAMVGVKNILNFIRKRSEQNVIRAFLLIASQSGSKRKGRSASIYSVNRRQEWQLAKEK